MLLTFKIQKIDKF